MSLEEKDERKKEMEERKEEQNSEELPLMDYTLEDAILDKEEKEEWNPINDERLRMVGMEDYPPETMEVEFTNVKEFKEEIKTVKEFVDANCKSKS